MAAGSGGAILIPRGVLRPTWQAFEVGATDRLRGERTVAALPLRAVRADTVHG